MLYYKGLEAKTKQTIADYRLEAELERQRPKSNWRQRLASQLYYWAESLEPKPQPAARVRQAQ